MVDGKKELMAFCGEVFVQLFRWVSQGRKLHGCLLLLLLDALPVELIHLSALIFRAPMSCRKEGENSFLNHVHVLSFIYSSYSLLFCNLKENVVRHK